MVPRACLTSLSSTGLRKAYRPGVPEAVAGISFEVREGEIFGLLGPNGAGKTTTIGAITTRVKPTGGRVTVDGHDVAREAVQVKRRLAVVPQRPNLDRALTALENLTFHAAYFGAPRRERRARAIEIWTGSGWPAARTRRSTATRAAWRSG